MYNKGIHMYCKHVILCSQCSQGGEFSSLMAFGKKLFMNLVVLHRMLRYRLPEGRRVNSLCAGWVWSLVILVALLWQRDGYRSWMDGCAVLVIFSAVLTTLCSAFWSAAEQLPYQTERLLVRMLSIAPLWTVVRAEGGRSALLIR